VIAAGPVGEALNDRTLSVCFGLPLGLERIAGRLFPHALHDRLDAPTAGGGTRSSSTSTVPGALAEADR